MNQVLRVITRLNIGGPARQALLLTKALRPEYRTILAAGFSSGAEGEMYDQEVEVTRLPLVRPISPAKDVASIAALRRLMIENRANIVHTHTAKAGTLGRLAALAVRPRPKLVHTFHGHVLEGYFRRPIQSIFVQVERRLAGRTDVLIAVSEEIKNQLLALKIGRSDQYRVIPVGLDLSGHSRVSGPSGDLRRELGLGWDVPLIGIVGRLAPIKDHATLLRALTALPAVHLAVVGDGELREALDRETERLGLSDRVHFTGWRLDVPAVMADLDAVVLTSRNEGTPVSLIEALACGRPIVATDVGGVRSVIDDGKTGYLTKAGDWLGVAEAIRSLLMDAAHAAKMAQRGRGKVTKEFSHERLIVDIKSLYAELL